MPKILENLNVLRTTVTVKNTGDGLSKAMQVQPPDLAHRDIVHVLLECEVIDGQTPVIPDTEGVELKYVLKAGRATIIEGKAALKALDDMDKKIEKAAGITRLPGAEDV